MNAPFDQLSTWLKEHRITEVECVISDLTGIARGKIAPTAKFLHERGMRLPESVLLQTVTGDYVDDDIYYNLLDAADIPTHWYNVAADLPSPLAPPLGPDGKPATPEQMGAIFPGAILEQEMSTERWIAIPEEVREIYRLWRPSPLVRAVRLEQALGTPAKIFFKYEGVSPAGSHKPNSAVPQAFYNKQAGIKRLTTETGAGQWGSSIAFAGQMFGLDVRVYMVKVSYEQKPYRRLMMQTWGAEVFASPSNLTNAGRAALAQEMGAARDLGLKKLGAYETALGDLMARLAARR